MSESQIANVKRYLCVKKLTVSDGFSTKSVKLPRAEARFFIGELRNRQATSLVLLDEFGESWELVCTCASGQYALSQIGAFCEAHGARPGCYFIFFADHEHLVRLAVRQQLPEDVQAAVATARAAMALRNSPQPKSSPEQQQPSSASSSPLLDDPVALDEMPLGEAAAAQHVGALAATAGKPAQASTPGGVRSKPLQDVSNVMPNPPGTSAINGGKPKPPGEKQDSSPSVSAPAHSVSAAGKENNQADMSGQDPVKPQASPAGASGLSSPGAVGGRAQEQQEHQQQAPGPRSYSPPPPPRSPNAQPATPPGSRVRMRFEARLRAQAGKPHPLSVSTGPDSPLPRPPLYRDTGFWPPGLMGPFGVGGVFQAAWCSTGGYGSSAGSHWRAGSTGAGSHSGGSSAGGVGLGATHGGGAQHHWQQGAAQGRGDDAAGDAAALAAEQEQQGACGSWRQQLQCDELMDWEVGRRMQMEPAAVPTAAAAPEHDAFGQSLMAPPDWLRQESPTTQTVRLALLHHLLLQSHGQQQASAGALVPSGRRFGGAPYGSMAPRPHPRLPDRGMSASAAATDSSAAMDWQPAAADQQQQRRSSSDGQQQPPHGGPGPVPRACAPEPQPGSHAHSRFGLVPALQQRGSAPAANTAAAAADSTDVGAGRAADAPPVDAPSPKRHLPFWPRPPAHAPPAPSGVAGGPRPPSSPRRPATGVAARLPRLRPVSSPAHPAPSAAAGSAPAALLRKALTAADLLSERVRFLLDASCPFLAQLPLRALSESGALGSGRAGGGGGAEPAPSSPSSSPGAAGRSGGGGAVAAGVEAGAAHRMYVDAVVESGAHYACSLCLSGPSNCQVAELTGLRPFLIRRQAGVGDMLSVEVSSSCGGGRLHVQLQRRMPFQ